MMSCVIDFSGQSRRYPVICEIDCLVIRDNHVLFTSCKSNKVAADDLNEIKVHNVIFGNTLSSPVMCTLEDLDQKSPSVYSKAREQKWPSSTAPLSRETESQRTSCLL